VKWPWCWSATNAGNGKSLTSDNPRCIEPVRIERDFFERRWWGNSQNAEILKVKTLN
jgi:hypothetical protein